LAFVVASILIELTPGPNMGYLAVVSASYGRRTGFIATLGVGLGLLIVGIATAFGLATLISNSRLIYEALRWAGVGYLLWLAWNGWRDADGTPPDQVERLNDAVFFRQGLLTNLLNPKAVVFFVAVLPTFVDASGRVLGQTLLLSLTYVAIATAIHVLIVTLAGTARHLLADEPRAAMLFRRGLSLGLAAIAIWFAVATAQP
jgi:threonine/homoserine/homoserine lactone efflux protein